MANTKKKTTIDVCMARNLGHRVSCDLHSGCQAMILTSRFLGGPGSYCLEKSSGQMQLCLWSNKGRCSKHYENEKSTNYD